MNKTLAVFFILSLGLNAFFVYKTHYGHPDYDFYSTGLRDAYYVRERTQDSYIIDHKGHRFAAKCRASLTWLDGTDGRGKPLSDGTCTYIPTLVGKSIAAGLMRHEGNSLVYIPWSDSDTVQTADILTITGDEAK